MTPAPRAASTALPQWIAELPDPSGRPAWLAELGRDARSWVVEHGLPTPKDEDWRYTRLAPIVDAPPERSARGIESVPSDDLVESLGSGPGTIRLVFVNGHLVPERSHSGALPHGVTVTGLASVIGTGDGPSELVRALLSRSTGTPGHAFDMLNTALAEDGAVVEVAPGVQLDEPVELIFLSDPSGPGVLSSPRSVVTVGQGSRVALVEIHAPVAPGTTCTNAAVQLELAERAQVELVRLQDEDDSALHLATLDVRQAASSQFSLRSFALGGSVDRYEVRVRLEGEDASTDLDGLYLCAGEQQHDSPILVEHAAPRCSSRQLYKGVVDDRGHGVFNGHIVVRPSASGTIADQVNRNLLLSNRAEVDTRPRLEILTDDVKCSHGATVGRLDDDALFYLRSRGIDGDSARSMLTYAFAGEMVDLVAPGRLHDRVAALVAERLEGRRAATAAGAARGRRRDTEAAR